MTRKSYEASFLTWTMVNSAHDYSPYETVRLHQRFWKCAVDFEMLLYSQQLTVRGRLPRMHFRVYEMQKAGSQDPLALHTTWQGAEDTQSNAILLAVSITKSFQCTRMFAVKPVFPYWNIHPIFWTASTQYISLHDRSFGGGILQLRNSLSQCVMRQGSYQCTIHWFTI